MNNISFFSFKGGSGRTSLLYNTLPFLTKTLQATPNEPIVVIDLDIDSKGLTYLINKKSKINSVQVLKGEFSRSPTIENIMEHPFFNELIPIGKTIGLDDKQHRSVLFIPANNDTLNDKNNFDGVNISLKHLYRLCKSFKCKAIIMDTPAGTQLAGDAALNISNKIVTVMRITKQFRQGTYEFLQQISDRFTNKEFLIVPNAIPDFSNSKYDLNNFLNEISVETKSIISSSHRDNRINLNLVDCVRGITEVQQFKFEEICLFKKKKYDQESLNRDEIEALKTYELLAKELSK